MATRRRGAASRLAAPRSFDDVTQVEFWVEFCLFEFRLER
jgi:hypothetical protein